MTSAQRAYIIPRPRLLQKISQTPERRIILISAPSGFGKTVLIEQFAADAPYPIAWHSIEERERDLPHLFTQSLSAISAIFPEIRAIPKPINASPSDLAARIANYLRDRIDTDFFYVLDDVHNIEGSPRAEAWLNSFISLAPPNCHLILVSRNQLSLPLLEQVTRGQVIAIGQDELRLTEEELENLTVITPGSQVAANMKEIFKRLEGWPAGVVLALHPLPVEFEYALLKGERGPEALFNALAENMLNTLPTSIKDFLLASSILDRVTAQLCSSALLLRNSTDMLNEISKAFLQRQLQETNPLHFQHLHKRAAYWFKERDELETAFVHYVLADRTDKAVEIANQAADSLFAEGKFETLLGWARKLEGIHEPSGVLFKNCAFIYTDRYEHEIAHDYLNKAEKIFREQHNTIGLERIELQRAMVEQQQGKLLEAITRAKNLISITNAENLRGGAFNILGLAYLGLGDLDVAIQYFKDALQILERYSDAYIRAQVFQNLGVAYERAGNISEASACLQKAVVLLKALGSERALALALNNLGFYFYQDNDYQQALLTFNEGLSIIARTPDRKSECYLLWSLGDLERDISLQENASSRYFKALELIQVGDPYLRCSILYNLARLQWWQKKWVEARETANEVIQMPQARQLTVPYNMAQAIIIACDAALEKSSDVLPRMDIVISTLREKGAKLKELIVLSLATHVALLVSGKRAANHYMRDAVQLAAEIGTAQPLAAEYANSDLLMKSYPNLAAQNQVIAQALQMIERATDSFRSGQNQEVNVSRKVQSLQVWTLGQVRVVRDGEIIAASDWQAVSARELFLFLLFNGSCTKDKVGLEFWPNLDTDKVRNNFHTSLHRAREALGENIIVQEEGIYSINTSIETWCDVYEFETFVEKAKLLAPKDARTEDLFDKAVSLYKGDFLPHMYMEWIAPQRTKLREIFIEALVGLAQCQRAHRDFRQATDTLQKALMVDPYREDIHRLILSYYAENGERQKLIVHYHELRRLFRTELDIDPSPETIKLITTLL
jgi:LuxR family maltose regulon positive regulatory protein